MRKSKVAIIEVSLPQKKSVAFGIGVEKLLSIYPKDTAEVILAIPESGLQSSVQAEENSGADLHQSPVVRDLKVIGVAWKERRRRVHRTTWNLESFAQSFSCKKESAHVGSRDSRNAWGPCVALERRKEQHS